MTILATFLCLTCVNAALPLISLRLYQNLHLIGAEYSMLKHTQIRLSVCYVIRSQLSIVSNMLPAIYQKCTIVAGFL